MRPDNQVRCNLASLEIGALRIIRNVKESVLYCKQVQYGDFRALVVGVHGDATSMHHVEVAAVNRLIDALGASVGEQRVNITMTVIDNDIRPLLVSPVFVVVL